MKLEKDEIAFLRRGHRNETQAQRDAIYAKSRAVNTWITAYLRLPLGKEVVIKEATRYSQEQAELVNI